MRSRAMLGVAGALALAASVGFPVTSDGLTGHSPFPDTSGDAKRKATRDDEARMAAAAEKRRRKAAKLARIPAGRTEDTP